MLHFSYKMIFEVLLMHCLHSEIFGDCGEVSPRSHVRRFYNTVKVMDIRYISKRFDYPIYTKELDCVPAVAPRSEKASSKPFSFDWSVLASDPVTVQRLRETYDANAKTCAEFKARTSRNYRRAALMRAKGAIKDLCELNFSRRFCKFITLTVTTERQLHVPKKEGDTAYYFEPIGDGKDLTAFWREFKSFIQLLRHTLGVAFHYLAVVHFQDGQRRDDKDESKATKNIHIHFFTDYTPVISQILIQRLWGHGIVHIQQVRKDADAANYAAHACEDIANYAAHELEGIDSDNSPDRLAGRRSYSSSRGLRRPIRVRPDKVQDFLAFLLRYRKKLETEGGRKLLRTVTRSTHVDYTDPDGVALCSYRTTYWLTRSIYDVCRAYVIDGIDPTVPPVLLAYPTQIHLFSLPA